MNPDLPEPRLADASDAPELAALLHAFNLEFAAPTPGPEALAPRLRRLLSGEATFAVIAGRPAVAVALVTLRPNVWCEGAVALLDELYVMPDGRNRGIGSAVLGLVVDECRRRRVELIEINVDQPDVDAQRFYERHGYSGVDPLTGERAYYYSLELS